MARKTCFVICPLGEPESETRQRSDDLFDLVIAPALEPYNFELIRADRIPGSGVITSEIVTLIQTADLCVVDLTDPNPNVYYECGRRHETDRPFIHMIEEGTALPFDIAGIRAMSYSLRSAREVHDSQGELRRYVTEFERSGYRRVGGMSPQALAATLERIESRIKAISVSLEQPGGLMVPTNATQSSSNLPSLTGRVPTSESALNRELTKALMRGDLNRAIQLFAPFRQKVGYTKDVAITGGILALAGYEQGADAVIQFAVDPETPADDVASTLTPICSALSYYYVEDREDEVVEKAEGILGRVKDLDVADRKGLAELYNQLQRYYHSLERYEEAVEAGNAAIALNAKASYLANVAQNYLELGRGYDATEMSNQLLEIAPDTKDIHCLNQMIRAYSAVGRADDARRLFERLRGVSPIEAAALLTVDEEVRACLGIEEGEVARAAGLREEQEGSDEEGVR